MFFCYFVQTNRILFVFHKKQGKKEASKRAGKRLHASSSQRPPEQRRYFAQTIYDFLFILSINTKSNCNYITNLNVGQYTNTPRRARLFTFSQEKERLKMDDFPERARGLSIALRKMFTRRFLTERRAFGIIKDNV